MAEAPIVAQAAPTNTALESTALATKSVLEKISDKLGANTDSADDNAAGAQAIADQTRSSLDGIRGASNSILKYATGAGGKVMHGLSSTLKGMHAFGKKADSGTVKLMKLQGGLLGKLVKGSLWTMKHQMGLAKAAKYGAGKVGDFAKAGVEKVKKFAGSILDFLKKGLGLAALWLLFEWASKLDWEGIYDRVKGFWNDIMKAWETEPGNIWQKFVEGFRAALKGMFNFIFDIAQVIGDIIDPFWDAFVGWFGELIGLSPSQIKTIQDFEMVKWLREQTDKAIDWVMDLFAWKGGTEKNLKKLLDIVLWSYNLAFEAVKLAFTWVTGDELTDKSFSDLVFEQLKIAWEWIKGIWAWGKEAGKTEEGYSFKKLALAAWEKVKEWFKQLVTFMDEGGVESWIQKTIDTVVTKVKEWFAKLFTWAETEDATDSYVVKYIKDKVEAIKYWFGQLFRWWESESVQESWIVKSVIKPVIKTIKEWFGKMFKFDSASNILKSYINYLTFLPNIIKDAVLSVGTWLLGLFGFDDAAKAVANAKKFTIGDLVYDAVLAIWEWFKKLTMIDVMDIAKSIPGGETLLKWMMGENIKEEKDVMKSMGLEQDWSDVGDWDLTKSELQKALKGKNKEEIDRMMKAVASMAEKGTMEERHLPDLMDAFGEAMKNAKAAGGPILKGIPALVGEKGPELFMPSVSGKIIPATETADMIGGGGGAPAMINAPVTNVTNAPSSTTMITASSSINPIHNKYFRN